MNALVLFAASLLGNAEDLGIPKKTADVAGLKGILDVIYMIAGVVAVIIMIVAAISYVTSSGDANKVKKAKDTIVYALIGLFLVIFAFTLTAYIAGVAEK